MSDNYTLVHEGLSRWINLPNNGGECCQTYADTVDELNRLLARVKRLVEALETLEVRGDQMNDELYPPDSNCSCHISPPCNDCVDWSSMRMAKRDWVEAKQKAAKAKGQP